MASAPKSSPGPGWESTTRPKRAQRGCGRDRVSKQEAREKAQRYIPEWPLRKPLVLTGRKLEGRAAFLVCARAERS